MAGYIGATSVSFDVTEADIKGDLKSTDDSPEVVLTNTTEEDTDGGRESKITFKGEQSGGELSTLAQIQASHDGTADDEKGDLIFSTNDGSDGNTPTERMRVDSAGNVGIGTSSPSAPTEIVATSSGAATDLLHLRNNATASSTGGTIKFVNSTAGNSNSGSAEITAIRTGTNTGELTFSTSNSSATITEAMRIDSDGNVGIGTTSPTDLLTLNATTPALDFLSSGTGKATILSGSGGALAFYTGGVFSGSGSERMRIDSSGNLGIGTTSPTELLTVRGAAHFGKTAIETSGDTPVIIKSDADHQALHIEENSGAESWQIGVDADGDLNFHNSGSATPSATILDSGDLCVGRTGPITFSANSSNGVVLKPNRLDVSASGVARITQIRNTSGTLDRFYNNASVVGSISCTTTATSYNTSSDYRLKENVTDVTDGITRVKQLAPKRFNFIADTDDTTVDGFLAHEAQTVVPEAVTGTHNEVETWTQEEIDAGDAPDNTSAGDNKLDGDGNTIPVYQGIDQAKLVPLLTAALQEAIAKIETLETKVAALESA